LHDPRYVGLRLRLQLAAKVLDKLGWTFDDIQPVQLDSNARLVADRERGT